MLELTNLHKTFAAGTPNEKKALKGLSLSLDAGDFCNGNRFKRCRKINNVQTPLPEHLLPNRSEK